MSVVSGISTHLTLSKPSAQGFSSPCSFVIVEDGKDALDNKIQDKTYAKRRPKPNPSGHYQRHATYDTTWPLRHFLFNSCLGLGFLAGRFWRLIIDWL